MKQPKRFVFSRRAPEIPDELPASAVLEETIIEQRVTGADWRGRTVGALRVEFVDCRMTGLSGGDVEGLDVLIRDGDQRYCQIRSSRFKGAEFDGCTLRNVEMGKAKLFNADLRGSIVEGLHIAPEGLRGAVADPSQAMSFALLLGIRIE